MALFGVAWGQDVLPVDATQRLHIVGGLGALRQYTRQEEPFWTREFPKLTGGKVSAEIVPFDRVGIRGQEMLRLMQLGVVPFGTALLSLVAAQEPLFAAPDLAGLSPDMQTTRKAVAAFRPYLEKTLRERYGIELLAVYTYPAQVIFCNKPFADLADLAGRRIRTSSPPQADLIEALGGEPIQTKFDEIFAGIKSGKMDCAITGAMSGNTVGLPEVTTHVYTMPINWGLSIFGANVEAWNALSPELRTSLKQELPKLELAIWNESERETGNGIACNIGSSSCVDARKYKLTAVKPVPIDDTKRRTIFANTVLSRWVHRCGAQCAEVWNQTIASVVGMQAKKTVNNPTAQ
ncbi:MAG: TRAP transporter substrate-binding protein [Burkholderiales bacterium]|nr:TRAP transporter substrate-binding protein [Burkholderiales bacterium]